MDLKVFMLADDDLRLARRIKRDTRERGRTEEAVLNQYNKFVKPSDNQFVKPQMSHSDLIISNCDKDR